MPRERTDASPCEGARVAPPRARVWATALALFVVSVALYRLVDVPERSNVSDPLLIVPTSLSLLHDGDLDLGEFGDAIDPAFYGVVFVDGRPYNRYPVGTSVLVLPIVWLADRLLPPAATPMAHALEIAAIAAKVLAASAVALVFLVLVELEASLRIAVTLALVFGFATVHFPIHAGGLFTHNAVIPLLLIALLLIVRRDGRWAGLAALPLGFAFATRPTCAPVVAGLAWYVARHRPMALPLFLLLGAVLGAAFVRWSWWTYGTPLPAYYWSYDDTSAYVMSLGRFAQGLVGHLVSPNRGVLVFTPILAFSLWGMVHAFRSSDRHAPLLRTLSVIVIVHWLMISVVARKWWAGWSFGPRHVVEIVPLLLVLLLPAIDAFRTSSRRVQACVVPSAAVALAWSLFVAVHGATSPAPAAWSSSPLDVDRHPERVWDWHDMQILRGASWP